MKIVVKFGGSSLASAEQFKKVADIIHADPHRRFVVPSAPGKRFDGDTKVTDMLYGCYDLAEAGKDFDGALADIKARYDEIIEGLELDLTLDKEFETIHEQFRLKAGRNYAASRGEYLNGIVLEANHDIHMLEVGPYPYYLKQRVLGDRGHLSNELSGRLLCDILHNNLRSVLLGHLSKENNYEELAYETVKLEVTLGQNPYKGDDIPIAVAKRDQVSAVIEV